MKIEKLKSAVNKKKYKARRRRIYKGKMSPPGTLYLHLRVYDGPHKYDAVQLIPGGIGQEHETNIVTQMYIKLQNKHFQK